MNSFFKNKKVSLKPKAVPPRVLAEIEKEHNQECWALGQLEYQVFVLKQEIDAKNKKIQNLNYEGAERKKLDAVSKPTEVPNESA